MTSPPAQHGPRWRQSVLGRRPRKGAGHRRPAAGILRRMSDLRDDLLLYLQRGREAVVWKLEGAGEFDVRRPLTPTGTNLLGLVKHLAAVDAGYLGEVFGRPFPEPNPWSQQHDDPEWDMWATAEESREELVGLYRRVWAHGDATVAALDLTSTGLVPWWPEERRYPTLQRVLVHLIAETHRHAG